jgi:hypothetical protein
MMTAKEVLKAAKNKKSHLHKYFEWDDVKAAQKYKSILK